MPAELEIPAEQMDEQEKTKSESDSTKEISAKMIKEEVQHSEESLLQATPQLPDTRELKNGSETVHPVPDIVEVPKVEEASEPEPLPDTANTQPDIVLEAEPQHPPEPEVSHLEKQPEQTPLETPANTDAIHTNGNSVQKVEEETVVVPELRSEAPVVQSLEPKTAPEVRSEIVKNLVKQSEREPESKAAVVQNGIPKKVQMMTSLDESAVRAAYEDVRADNTETQWAVFKFQGARIVKSAIGAEFETFRAQFRDDERAFGFLRVQVGDELSKRQKFVFITWVGPSVSVIQRAKMSTDKALMKNIISNFAVELQPETLSEINLDHFKMELNKAGGANYGTGVRDL